MTSAPFRRDLLPHPVDAPGPVVAIRANVERGGDRLALTFALAGDVDSIRLPVARGPRRADGLWHHTCFEVFLRRPGHEDYLEFNFAPFGPWAAYHFDGYRSGKRDLVVAAPSVGGMTGPDVLSMFISLKVPPSAWDIGFSAVIEDMDGHISYWALAHPPGKPDFHHPDCFALELPAPDGA